MNYVFVCILCVRLYEYMRRKSNRLGTILLLFSIFQGKEKFPSVKAVTHIYDEKRVLMEHIMNDVSYRNSQ